MAKAVAKRVTIHQTEAPAPAAIAPAIQAHVEQPAPAPSTREQLMSETPSETLVREAKREAEVRDSKGRLIKLGKPSILAEYRIVSIVGDENARNQVYMSMVMPLLYVTHIDGDPVFFPNSRIELEALIQRMDREGVEAIMLKVQEVWGAPDPEAAKAAVKK